MTGSRWKHPRKPPRKHPREPTRRRAGREGASSDAPAAAIAHGPGLRGHPLAHMLTTRPRHDTWRCGPSGPPGPSGSTAPKSQRVQITQILHIINQCPRGVGWRSGPRAVTPGRAVIDATGHDRHHRAEGGRRPRRLKEQGHRGRRQRGPASPAPPTTPGCPATSAPKRHVRPDVTPVTSRSVTASHLPHPRNVTIAATR